MVTAHYLVFTGGFCSLLVVTAHYCSRVVIPTFSMNKPVDAKSKTYITSNKEINDKDPKFKVGDNARISKY